MRKPHFMIALAGILAISSPVHAGGFIGDIVKGATGGAVDLDNGEVCAVNQCINSKGETRTKSVDEVLDDNLGRVPGYQLLSEADKQNIRTAAKVGAVIAVATSDPVTGGLVISIISGDQKEEVPVPTYKPNPPATQVSYKLSADCIVKRGENNFTVAFKEDNQDAAKVKVGDTISVVSTSCPSFEGSVTSVEMKATSELTAVPSGRGFKWMLLGELNS
ncbi:hypothetical protein [Rhizobium hidalgonense]|uniref:Uncharacterized protein n=1 Tax=Rhizobium hidalgonense TaxID=1538159 RepID=A0ABX4JM68_9HYPH|nr:hypothetical protein [Rhizobium hidalgonense]PDT20051.1 hypothetical protein CO674_29830 [Rhizobium hidalgonense]PON05929.1 hypothetical protein ATY29_19260 [Rhizobium hidalgonense]